VVNFDFPLNPVDYLHRTGRTARAGARGRITSLVTRRDQVHLRCQAAVLTSCVVGNQQSSIIPLVACWSMLWMCVLELQGAAGQSRENCCCLEICVGLVQSLVPRLLPRFWHRG